MFGINPGRGVLSCTVRTATLIGCLAVGQNVLRLLWKAAYYKWRYWTLDYAKFPWIWNGREQPATWRSIPLLMILGMNGGLKKYLDLYSDPDTGVTRPIVYAGFSSGFNPVVGISDSKYFSEIFNDLESFPKYTGLYALFDLILAEGLVTAKGEHHKNQRKLITPVFHFAALKSAMDVLQRNAMAFLEEELPRGNFIISDHSFKTFTLGSIIDYAFSGEFDKKWMQIAWHNILAFIRIQSLIRIFLANYISYLPTPTSIYVMLVRWKISRYLERRRQYLQSCNITQELVLKAVGDQQEASTSASSRGAAASGGPELSIDLGMNLADQLILGGCPPRAIADECLTFLFAGEDTTGSLLSFAAHELSRCPTEQALLRAEVASVLGPGPVRGVGFDAVKRLERVAAALKETLRLWPPVFAVPRVNRRADFEVAGLRVPVGTTLDLSVYAAHRDAAVFPAPHAFRPGRWLLPSDSEEVRRRGPYSFVPFIAGPRNCIGQKFAMQEATVMLAMLLSRYELVPLPGAPPMQPVVAVIMQPSRLAVLCKPL